MNMNDTRKCHGCSGKGWVTVDKTAQTCPICKGTGKRPIRIKIKKKPLVDITWNPRRMELYPHRVKTSDTNYYVRR